MKPLASSQKQEILARLFWDTQIEITDAEAYLEEQLRTIDKNESQQFFRRLLCSCDWYTLLKLMGPEKLTDILTDPVIGGIFPRGLKTKYEYARDILSR
ncbi:hypothetical protein DSCW_03710 [Desulfosarcina widdelii]|uniref:Uncharacterized protein n=1 Tax=Desulfosarcina widdelii TaxID=947919 RepID=A0A5K7Z3B3_9BACT|nr:hypothetical protein [Desulfosarcina widdelii]BBO72954.1 hypothetical protein DSCW_03710 [Desulfosarcina widdelii]